MDDAKQKQKGQGTALYGLALRVMFRMAPERVHGHVMRGLTALSASKAARSVLRRALVVDDPILKQEVAGLVFDRPLGLAAGFDKNATAADVWGPVGFGFAEVGTVTAVAQPGNVAPRLFRLPEDRAILNRMGFNNEGALAAAQRLAGRAEPEPIGVNLGKSKLTDPAVAPHDYAESTRAVRDVADYLVINVSSPNTPGLRDLQAVESLRSIISAVQREAPQLPLFVKIAPDLRDEDIVDVADLAIEMGITGLIATNTTISREGLVAPASYVQALGPGGVSGAPLRQRAQEVLELLYAHTQGRLVLIAVGGIETAEQAWERIVAGANLLQGYTGMIYGGPQWIRGIHRGLAHQLRVHGFSSLSDAVGSGASWKDVR